VLWYNTSIEETTMPTPEVTIVKYEFLTMTYVVLMVDDEIQDQMACELPEDVSLIEDFLKKKYELENSIKPKGKIWTQEGLQNRRIASMRTLRQLEHNIKEYLNENTSTI
jgi:hypothetical protein